MALYFFDTCDGEFFVRDYEGQDMPDIEAAKAEAARCLTDFARDVVPRCYGCTLVVQVRDDHRPVLKAQLSFESVLLFTD